MLDDHGSVQFGLGIYNQYAQVDFHWLFVQSGTKGKLHLTVDGRELWRGKAQKSIEEKIQPSRLF